jgi:hypothetical protein
MDVSSLGDAVGGRLDPRDKLAEQARKRTSRYLRFQPRTRAFLVYGGSVAIISSWLLPWYDFIAWVKPGPAANAALRAGYGITHLASDPYAGLGYDTMQREFTGANLAAGPAALRSIAFSQHDFYVWLGLAAFSLLALWTYERPGLSMLRRRFYRVIQTGKVLLLVATIGRSVWKGVDLASLGTVNRLARGGLASSLPPGTDAATAVPHFQTSYSVGLIILTLGLILSALGVFSGNKQPAGGLSASSGSTAEQDSGIAFGCLIAAALFILASWALFG